MDMEKKRGVKPFLATVGGVVIFIVGYNCGNIVSNTESLNEKVAPTISAYNEKMDALDERFAVQQTILGVFAGNIVDTCFESSDVSCEDTLTALEERMTELEFEATETVIYAMKRNLKTKLKEKNYDTERVRQTN